MRRLFLFLLIACSTMQAHATNFDRPQKVGLCIVATSKYSIFVSPLIQSARKYFCTDHDVRFIVFTDQEIEESDDTLRVEVEHLGWPYATLMRFHMYSAAQEWLSEFDYLFAIDADALFNAPVGEEVLSENVFTIHPGFYKGRRGTYESQNKQSTAYVGPSEGLFYFAGGVYGGSREGFFRFVNKAKEMVDRDLENDYIAIWHDESYLNRYAIDHPPTHVLTPAYCYPEDWRLPYQKKIIVLNKDHQFMREY